MRNNYEYIDPDYIYTDPKIGILRNKGGVSSYEDLVFMEGVAFLKRSNELKSNPIEIKDSRTLMVIHQHLFNKGKP